ncbi:MAG TPA: GAF domain-containing protein [Candidatus Limnocylindrales bacterium]|nr:GAF domain-containing protein [Candidatus Limnocylindrales bacterium]
MPLPLPSHPLDATLTVTKAARVLGVHPNTIRAWSDQGRLRYYRINDRGDRRYRHADLVRFLDAAEVLPPVPRPAAEASPGHVAPGAGRGRLPRPRPIVPPAGPRRTRGDELLLVAELAELAVRVDPGAGRGSALETAVQRIRAAMDAGQVALWEHRDGRLACRVVAGEPPPRLELPADSGLLAEALAHGIAVRPAGGDDGDSGGRPPRWQVARAVAPGPETWGVLHVSGPLGAPLEPVDRALVGALARTVAAIVGLEGQRQHAARRVHASAALGRIAADLSGRSELDDVLDGLGEHAGALFGTDHAAAFVRGRDGSFRGVGRGLSAAYLRSPRSMETGSLIADAIAAGAPRFTSSVARDPRVGGQRAALVQEGTEALAVAPLMAGRDLVGLLEVHHRASRDWAPDELEALAELAGHGAVAIRAAQRFDRMATWAAQLQSIQQLGTRLSRLTSVPEIANAIATELRELIDYHNIRVYRLHGEDLIPVAMLGQVGEYVDETPDQLRSRLGQGLTGWVAEHRIAQSIPDAARDPRALTIAGTDEDLDESMLLAPMLHEDECLGVVVLSRLGLHQFDEDDLRLLVIYASFAAQAMANADATERLRAQSAALERRLVAQRELLRVTESILTALDTREVLERIAERLGALVEADNIAIEVVHRQTGILIPVTARGVHAEHYLVPWEPGETGLATWVVEHNEAAFVEDERSDPRVNHFRGVEEVDGSLIVVPLRGPEGAVGVLTLERLGRGRRFDLDEFELVKLFAAQVSIALRNAELFHAVEVRAQTDALTGLLNHGTFQDRLRRQVAIGDPFSLVMVDLDLFKRVNDELGHQAGDRLLHDIATAILGAARETDQVFRYGGDEFAIILPHAGAAEALGVGVRVAAAIRDAGGATAAWRERGIDVSASVGVASAPSDGSTADEILLAADRACFVAKRRGQGFVATAADGRVHAATFTLSEPTPVDPPTTGLDDPAAVQP